ncbi:carboxylate/amino acid/amine transporter [compost metagenome]
MLCGMKTSEQFATHQSVAGHFDAQGQLANGGTLAFLLGSLVLSTVGIFVHEAGTDPLTAVWFRCAFGLLGLTLWAAWRRQLSDLQLCRAPGFTVLAAGVLMVVAWGLFFASIEYISVGIATVLFHVQPLWVLLLGAFYLKEPIAKRRIAAVLVAMLGLILATGILEHLSLFGLERTIQATYWLGVALERFAPHASPSSPGKCATCLLAHLPGGSAQLEQSPCFHGPCSMAGRKWVFPGRGFQGLD